MSSLSDAATIFATSPDFKLASSNYESLSPDSGFSDHNGNVSLSTDDDKSLPEVFSGRLNGLSPGAFTLPGSLAHLTSTDRLLAVQKVLDVFFSNQIKYAEALIEPHRNSDINFSHVSMCLASISSFMTLDPDLMEGAKTEVKRHLDFLYDKRPRRGTFYRFFGREDYNAYTDEEMLAELNYAEALFVYSVLTFFHGQSIMTLIKAAFKLNTAHGIINFCHDVLKSKTNWKEEHVRYTFAAGALVGVGFSNLMLSNMPSSILKLLAIVGLTGDRDLGVAYLEQVSKMENQSRIQMCYCMILGYNIYLEQMLGSGEGATEWADEIADKFLTMYPDGAVPLLLNARVSLLRSDPGRAIAQYQRCLDIKNEWSQIDLFCYFDLVWCHAVRMDWANAAKYCDVLRQKCSWGHAINMHLFACFKYMQNETEKDPKIKTEIASAMSQVEKLRKRYAGRTYPAEKFAIERSKKFFVQFETCQLPAFELFYVWNIFSMLKRDPQLLQPIADMIDAKMAVVDERRDLEDKCVLLLLRGVCAKYLKEYEKAIECLDQVTVLESEPCLTRSYVVPHSMMELGLVYKSMGDFPQARYWIEKAKSSSRCSKYLLEALVQIKSHNALRQIDEQEGEECVTML